MPTIPVITFTGDYLKPLYNPAEALCEPVNLAPGTYVKGTVLGNVNGTGTAVNDVQTLTVTGTPTGGTLTVYWNGVAVTLAYNSTVAQTQAKFDGVTAAAGDITVGGGTLPGNTQTFTFQGDYAGLNQPPMTVSNNLTGGASPAAGIAHTTPGKPAAGYWAAYNDANSDGTQTARKILQYDTTVNPDGTHVYGGGEFGSAQYSAPAYFSGTFLCSDLVGLDANGLADLGRLVDGNLITDTNPPAVIRIG